MEQYELDELAEQYKMTTKFNLSEKMRNEIYNNINYTYWIGRELTHHDKNCFTDEILNHISIVIKEFIRLDKEFHKEMLIWANQFAEYVTDEQILEWWEEESHGAKEIKEKYNKLAGDKLNGKN